MEREIARLGRIKPFYQNDLERTLVEEEAIWEAKSGYIMERLMHIRKLLKVIVGVLAGLMVQAAPASDSTKIMHFSVVHPIGVAADLLTNSWYIYGSGEIDAGAAPRLKALVTKDKIPPSSLLFLDSPGGSLLGSIELGREIRNDGFFTYVNAANGMTDAGTPASMPAVCASACTLAFLGGRFRFIDDKSIYAVHRFYFPEKNSSAADDAQILSSAIVQYLRDMGVDPKLFTLSTEAGRDNVVVLNHDQLLNFNVVNNGADKPIWSIEAIPDGMYLKGEHNTIWGDNKIVFFCGKPGSLMLAALFPLRGRQELIALERAGGLLLDGEVVKIPAARITQPVFRNGIAALTLKLTKSEIEKVLHAHTVGASFQITYDAPTFDGIADFDFTDGRKKIVGFMKACH